MLSRDHDQDLSHHLDEAPPNITISEDGPSSNEPSNGFNKQRSDLANVESHEPQTQDDATPESGLSGCVIQSNSELPAYFALG